MKLIVTAFDISAREFMTSLGVVASAAPTGKHAFSMQEIELSTLPGGCYMGVARSKSLDDTPVRGRIVERLAMVVSGRSYGNIS